MAETVFLVYDGRAILEGTDDLNVLTVAKSLREARRDARDFGYECAIFQYRVQQKGSGERREEELVDERFVESVQAR